MNLILPLLWLASSIPWSGREALPSFKDVTAELGLSCSNDRACWFDLDNDGWPDLLAGGDLWRNEKGKKFALFAKLSSSGVAADFDNDGYTDVFCYGTQTLFVNLKGKGFAAFPMPKLPATVSRAACWGDFDGDGFVDLFVGGYEDWNKGVTYPSYILMNRKGKAFELTWSEAKFRTRGVSACDFDGDGDLDVYCANYRLQPNNLWVGSGTGKFVDRAGEFNAAATSPGFDGGHSIGAAWGDFDSDGVIDLFAGNFAHVDSRGDQPKSRFLRNAGSKGGYRFEDKGTCGVFYQESYASPAAGDFDNDGLLDLYFTTVYETASFNRPNNPVLFKNGGGFQFLDRTAATLLPKLGATYQAAWADFDRDGDLDLVTCGKLFANSGSKNHWIGVRMVANKEINRNAIGAQVRIATKGMLLTRQVEAGTGEGNQNDLTLHFGLGANKGPVSLMVTWPDGRGETTKPFPVDRIIEVQARR
ncbi:MAG: CRTAC1 family protein [Armatimonadetes bacterium]|nr:CRTAC1 family protein [Armatimonadota bacterium]